MSDKGIIQLLNNWDDFIPEQALKYINEHMPTKVKNRVHKSKYHYDMAIKIQDIDPEMAIFRLIASEEELVVAIFESIKISNYFKTNQVKDFTRKFKNHAVKQSLSQAILWIIYNLNLTQELECSGEIFSQRITYENDMFHFEIVHVGSNTPIKVQLFISNDDMSWEEVINALYSDMEKNVIEQGFKSLKKFIDTRAELRNKLLYAEDGGIIAMHMSFQEVLKMIKEEIRALSFGLVISLDKNLLNSPIVRQTFDLYVTILERYGIRDLKNV